MEQINEIFEVSTYLPGRYGPLFVPWTHYAKGTPADNSSAGMLYTQTRGHMMA